MKFSGKKGKKLFLAGLLVLSMYSCVYGANYGNIAVPSSGLATGMQGTGQTIMDGYAMPDSLRYHPDEETTAGTLTSKDLKRLELIGDTPTEDEINTYFDQILFSKTAKNPMGSLLRRLPRYGMSFFQPLNPPSASLSTTGRTTTTSTTSQTRQTSSQNTNEAWNSSVITNYDPIDNVPVTQDYRIGTGDEITLTLWGIPEEGSFRVMVNRDGMATIPHIGAVRLAGYTLAEGERIIASRLNQYYTGYQMNLSMGRLRSITVYVTGNAQRPGAYSVSSFATLMNALLASGGPSQNGSLRKIELKRGNKTITIFDMYAMLLQGDKTQDARLQNGDVIYIPPVGPLVGVAGEVQTPGVYELNGATRLKDLLYIAGGLRAQTSRGRIQFYRVYNNEYAGATEGSFEEIENTELQDGDIIRMYPIYNFAATASVNGQVMREGSFVIVPGYTRISDLINRAGGLSSTASEKAELTRVTPSLDGPVQERFNIDILQALRGDPMQNMTLENGDQLTVLVIPDWKQQIRVTVEGEVKRPGVYSMFAGEKLSDLLERVGGFTRRAFLRGAIFTRLSVAEEQKKALNQVADRMQQELLEAMQNTASAGLSNSAAFGAEYQRRMQLINNLRELDIMGRVITKVDTPANIKGTPYDYELQDGDTLTIPDTPLVVHVMGAVYTSSSQVYRPDMGINGYISAAGGAIKTAHKRMVYLLKSDGSTVRLTRSTAMLSSKQWTAPRGFSAKVEPGDTIVVPVKYMNRESIETFKDTIDIIYKVAVAAGVILDQIND